MSELIDRQALRAAHGLGADCHDCKRDMKSCQYDRDYSLMDFCEWIDDAPTASPWHRVEDGLPEPHKKVLVSGMEAINNSRVYKVMINDNGTWRPMDYAPSIRWDYWMPIEPPKEEEHGN